MSRTAQQIIVNKSSRDFEQMQVNYKVNKLYVLSTVSKVNLQTQSAVELYECLVACQMSELLNYN